MAKHVLTPQKEAACAALHAGMTPEQACEVAGYSRPDTASQKLFHRQPDGSYRDTAVAAELARLAGDVEHEAEALDALDMEALPKAVLAEMARKRDGSDVARVNAAKALDAIHEREKAREPDHLDEYQAANAVRRLLGMPTMTPDEFEVWQARRANYAST